MNMLNYAAAAGLSALTVYLMIVGNAILLPLVIAVFVWYLINALATATYNLRIRGKALPRSLRFGAAIVILLAVSWLVLNLVVGNINQVVAAVPRYEQNLRLLAEGAGQRIGLEYVSRVRALFDGLDFTNWVRRLAGAAGGVIGSIGTIAIYVTFLLLEQHSFNQKVSMLFPDAARQALVRRILQRIGNEVQTYVWLKTLTSLLTGVGSYLVMKIAGVDFAEFWALLIFALNYIRSLSSLPRFLPRADEHCFLTDTQNRKLSRAEQGDAADLFGSALYKFRCPQQKMALFLG